MSAKFFKGAEGSNEFLANLLLGKEKEETERKREQPMPIAEVFPELSASIGIKTKAYEEMQKQKKIKEANEHIQAAMDIINNL